MRLFGLPVTRVELLETQAQRVEERRADLVAKVSVQGQPPFILHIEIQNDNQRWMPARMLRYLGDLALAYPKLPVRQYLVYIGKKPLTMKDGLDFPDFQYRYRIIDLRRVDCEDFLRQDSPDAWVLAVLCDFKHRLPREVVHTILARLQQRLRDDPPRLREYVEMLNVLADNRDLNLDIYEELNMLNIDIERLAIYRIGMEKGLEQGIEQGERIGEQEGEHKRSVAIAANLLGMGLGLAQIADATGLPLTDIEALAREHTPHNG